MAWVMKGLRKDEGERRYQPPRVRKLGGKGMHNTLTAFVIMKNDKNFGEKVLY